MPRVRRVPVGGATGSRRAAGEGGSSEVRRNRDGRSWTVTAPDPPAPRRGHARHSLRTRTPAAAPASLPRGPRVWRPAPPRKGQTRRGRPGRRGPRGSAVRAELWALRRPPGGCGQRLGRGRGSAQSWGSAGPVVAEATRPGTTWAGASGREQQTAGVGPALGPRRLSEPTKSLGLEGDLATPPSKARGQDALSGMLWAGWGRDEAGQRGRRPAGNERGLGCGGWKWSEPC